MSSAPLPSVDCIVIGAGVVGLAAARALQRAGLETFVIEANPHFGMETSSRNSEVIHAGIYYPSRSLKAKFCVAGRRLLYDYCAARNIPHRRTGKLIVATEPSEVPILSGYLKAAQINGVDDLRCVGKDELRELEPSVRAVSGLLSPSTGIIDSHAYMQALLDDFEMAGGHLVYNTRIVAGAVTDAGIRLRDDRGDEYLARRVVNSAGLGAPALSLMLAGLAADHVPVAHYAIGHYYVLSGKSPFNRLVYPVAVAGGLGVHVTLDMGGGVRFGPDIRWIGSADYAFDDSRRADFVAAIRRYYPQLEDADLQPGYTGIRPKIAGPDNSSTDFVIQGPSVHGIAGLINLFGIESPGLTASLAIADHVLSLIGTGRDPSEHFPDGTAGLPASETRG